MGGPYHTQRELWYFAHEGEMCKIFSQLGNFVSPPLLPHPKKLRAHLYQRSSSPAYTPFLSAADGTFEFAKFNPATESSWSRRSSSHERRSILPASFSSFEKIQRLQGRNREQERGLRGRVRQRMTIDHPIWRNFGSAVDQCWHGAQSAVQGFQSSIAETLPRIPKAFEQGQQSFKSRLMRQNALATVADKIIPDVGKELKLWQMNPTWEDEKARIEVTVPAGALCELNSTFKVGLPPLAVFDILSDPGNKRVFKDIKEVKSRKVLEDYGERQILEVEQAAIWRFLWLSGTLDVCVKVEQDRRALSLTYQLGKEGFMKRFEGSWVIEPLYVDADKQPDLGRVASLVQLRQVVEPAMMPPPPINWYVRGITSRTTEKMLEDLQAEGKRLREAGFQSKSPPTEITENEIEKEKPRRSLLHRYGKLPSRASGLHRRDRKKWRRINL